MPKGVFYDTAGSDCQYIAQVYSSEDVVVGGKVDDTLLHIRRGVTHMASSLDSVWLGDKRALDDEEMESALHMRTTNSDIKHFVAGTSAQEPHGHVLT